jgi:hypothetical protein
VIAAADRKWSGPGSGLEEYNGANRPMPTVYEAVWGAVHEGPVAIPNS